MRKIANDTLGRISFQSTHGLRFHAHYNRKKMSMQKIVGRLQKDMHVYKYTNSTLKAMRKENNILTYISGKIN